MQEFYIKTWACDSCSYKQDMEPTQANADLHFNKSKGFRLNDLLENECPSCKLKGGSGVLSRVTDNAKKSKITAFDSEKDRAKMRARLMSKPKRRHLVGTEERVETDEEHDERVDALKAPGSFKARLKVGRKKIVRKFPIFEEETDEERKARVDQQVADLVLATPKEIQALRDKYEDKE